MHVIKTCYHWSAKTNKSPDCSRISHISYAFSSIQMVLHYQTNRQNIQYSLFIKRRLTAHKDKSTPKFQIPERKPSLMPKIPLEVSCSQPSKLWILPRVPRSSCQETRPPYRLSEWSSLAGIPFSSKGPITIPTWGYTKNRLTLSIPVIPYKWSTYPCGLCVSCTTRSKFREITSSNSHCMCWRFQL